MKNKALIIALLLSAFSLSAFAKVDCDDPKNTPRYVGGGLWLAVKWSVLSIAALRSGLNATLI